MSGDGYDDGMMSVGEIFLYAAVSGVLVGAGFVIGVLGGHLVVWLWGVLP